MENTEKEYFNVLSNRAYAIARAHGFHEKDISIATYFMLIITEASEAVEADRKNRYALINGLLKKDYSIEDFEVSIKDTVEDELADIIIRLLDFAGAFRVDIYPNNIDIDTIIKELREKNTPFSDLMYSFISEIICDRSVHDMSFKISLSIEYILAICKVKNIDIMWHVAQKMKYNETRPYKHHKSY